MDIFIGFDSAWTDNVRGAICAVGIDGHKADIFHAPRLAHFEDALGFIQSVRSDNGITLIALDQSTIVENLSGCRPVERVAASVIGWMGGGVQPSHRGREGMFCDDSPIWRFLTTLAATEDPECARTATEGHFLMEVFPALALASLNANFFGRLAGPRYNPARKNTFRSADWCRVAETAASSAGALECHELASWCRDMAAIKGPRKADQDLLDAAICAIIALHWRLRSRAESLMLGDLISGYMVMPIARAVRERLIPAARRCSVAMDGEIPT